MHQLVMHNSAQAVTGPRTRHHLVENDHVVVPLRRRHLHSWHLSAVEHDRFGTVRMMSCTCGAELYDDRPAAG